MKVTILTTGAASTIFNEMDEEQVQKIREVVMGDDRFLTVDWDGRAHLINLDNVTTIHMEDDRFLAVDWDGRAHLINLDNVTTIHMEPDDE